MLIPDLAAVLGSALSGDFGERPTSSARRWLCRCAQPSASAACCWPCETRAAAHSSRSWFPCYSRRSLADRAVSHLPVPEGTLSLVDRR